MNGQIKWLKSGRALDVPKDRDVAQKAELEHFLDIAEGKCTNDSTTERAVRVLRLTKGEI